MPSYSQETVLEQKRIRLGLYLSTFSAGCGRVVKLANTQARSDFVAFHFTAHEASFPGALNAQLDHCLIFVNLEF
jgi:hypothetical protein